MKQGSQGQGGVKAPPTAGEGLPIPIDIQVPGVTEVLVIPGIPGEAPSKIPVGPGGRAIIPPNPNWTGGTILFVSLPGPPFTTIAIEIVSTD